MTADVMIRWGLFWELLAGPHLPGYVQRIEARDACRPLRRREPGN